MTAPADLEDRLHDEIEDLKSTLADVPAPLRNQGLFAGYESRLTSLEEQLLSLRVKQLMTKYAELVPADVAREEPPSTSLATAEDVSRAVEAVERMRQRRHRSMLSYRYSFFMLAGALIASGVVLAGNTGRFLTLAAAEHSVGMWVVIVTVGQLVVRHFENVRAEAESHLELLRNQLESLSNAYKATQKPEPKSYERTLPLLRDRHVK
jgi:hypothetical protein